MPYAQTDENLLNHALEPTFRWLIAAALDGSSMTYGSIKAKLESEEGFSTIFTTRIGFVAGSLMNKIQDAVPNAPLINVLVVNQTDYQPSTGARTYLADKFKLPKLAQKNSKKHFSKLWQHTVKRAANEVYALGTNDWAALYKASFKKSLSSQQISKLRDNRKSGAEENGLQGGGKYGPGGEGKHHRALRLWITDNPAAVRKSFANAKTETESGLDSGDRIDVVYKCADRIVLLEVKSRISNEIDLKRGVYQCIKYRAVRAAMDVRDTPLIETYLVTEQELPKDIAALLRLHDIKHFLAPQDRT
jgi:hypothetical protein